MNIRKIKVEFEKGGYVLIWTGVIAPEISEKIYGIFSITCFNKVISLKFIWYMYLQYRVSLKTKIMHQFGKRS